MRTIAKHHDKTKRVMGPDIFDFFEFSALAFGGIGRDDYLVRTPCDTAYIPCCIYGHAGRGFHDGDLWYLTSALADLGINTLDNDKAVGNINAAHKRKYDHRVSWADYCAYFNIVRGN